MEETLILSTLPKTWIFDLDGTILKHNGYKTDGVDTVLPEALQFLAAVPEADFILLLTSRTEEYRAATMEFLERNAIRYDQILFGMPMGERIVVNDRKPSGIEMAYAVGMERDRFKMPKIECRL